VADENGNGQLTPAQMQTGIDELREGISALEDAVVKSKSVSDTVAAVGKLEEANKAISKAESKIADAMFEANAEIRDTAIAAVTDLVGSSDAFTQAFDLGVSRFEITRDDDGNVIVTDKQPGRGGRGGGGGKGRLVWAYEGSEYTSRELLESFFEAKFGAEAMAKVWEGVENKQGFDQPVKRLGKELGIEPTRPAAE
jgi:hypothetical protein